MKNKKPKRSYLIMLDLYLYIPVSVYSLQGVPAFVAKYTLSQVPVSRENSTSYLTDCE